MSNKKLVHDLMNKLQELMGIAAFTTCRNDGIKIELIIKEIARMLERIQDAD